MPDQLILMKPAEVRQLVQEAVREELANLRPAEGDRILDREECAQLLGVTPRTIATYVKDHGLPGRRLGGHIWRFRKSAVLAWAEGKRT